MYIIKSRTGYAMRRYVNAGLFFFACLVFCYSNLIFGISGVSGASASGADDAPADIIIIYGSDCGNDTSVEQFLHDAGFPYAYDISDDCGYMGVISVAKCDAQNALSYIRNIPDVESADFDAKISIYSDDEYSDTQWYEKNTGNYRYIIGESAHDYGSAKGIDMKVNKAWKIYGSDTGASNEVVVAVIDTGVDYRHPDLEKAMWTNSGEVPDDGIDNDGNGYVDDYYGWDFYNGDSSVCHYSSTGNALASDNDNHGTHVAGIIAATANNGIGIAGVASNVNVKIMSLKIHGGKNDSGSISDAIKAIHYACMMGADICNLSWGTDIDNSALYSVMKESDMLFVCAAGNDGSNNNSCPVYPASYKLTNSISVTFIDPDGYLAGNANYGTDIDIAAPGVHIYSTVVGGDYKSFSGSSMSAPMISAVAAMIYASGEKTYPSNVKEIILGSVMHLDSLDGLCASAGIPDCYAIATAINSSNSLQSIPASDHIIPRLTYTTEYRDSNIRVSLNAIESGGSGLRVIKYMYGVHGISYFKHGTVGTSVNNTMYVDFFKAGKYTFYISDYAGNERIIIVNVLDDVVAPEIESSCLVYYNYSKIKISLSVSDYAQLYRKSTGSGIKVLKYAKGQKSEEYFTAGNGTVLDLDGTEASFKVKISGLYTIYACDWRGNKTISYVYAKIIKSTKITLSNSFKVLNVNESYRLGVSLYPSNSTDRLKFTSSDTDIAAVTNWGTVKAVSSGNAVITVKAASGVIAKCFIRVCS